MYREKTCKYRKVFVFVILIMLGLDIINFSSIVSVPFSNINLDLWNIMVVIILYVMTYEIIQKKDNCRKENQDKVARLLLENTYQECKAYKDIIANQNFKKICPKRFPVEETMENNVVYQNMRNAPFNYDSIIYSLGEEGIISASNFSNYLMVKNRYSIYFSNVTIFPDRDEITDCLKKELEYALDKAISELNK